MSTPAPLVVGAGNLAPLFQSAEISYCASQKPPGFSFLIPVSDRRDQIFSS